ncbi:MAG: hypothetical protein MJZ22_00525 [Candidatus Saccharibacteria bacterium]|nr:hypothetical protein [Candidatus Saccharibacteria bacterium]
MKRTVLLSTFSLLCGQAIASEIHPFIRGYAPTSASVTREFNGASSQSTYGTGITFGAGAEFLAGMDFAPIYFGGGVGFSSAATSHGLEIAPAIAPIWATLSLRATESYNEFVPYVTMRAGWAMPLSTSSSWWKAPANFVVEAGVGATSLKGVGFEFSYTYTSLEKSFSPKNLDYRISSGRFGLTCFMSFELTHAKAYVPNEEVRPEEEETEEHVVNTPVIKEISSEPAEPEKTTEQPEAKPTEAEVPQND